MLLEREELEPQSVAMVVRVPAAANPVDSSSRALPLRHPRERTRLVLLVGGEGLVLVSFCTAWVVEDIQVSTQCRSFLVKFPNL